jgi:hypothetical protein
MPKLPIIFWEQLEKIFILINNPEKILVFVAKREIPRGTLREKIRFLGITRKEFFDLLRKI